MSLVSESTHAVETRRTNPKNRLAIAWPTAAPILLFTPSPNLERQAQFQCLRYVELRTRGHNLTVTARVASTVLVSPERPERPRFRNLTGASARCDRERLVAFFGFPISFYSTASRAFRMRDHRKGWRQRPEVPGHQGLQRYRDGDRTQRLQDAGTPAPFVPAPQPNASGGRCLLLCSSASGRRSAVLLGPCGATGATHPCPQTVVITVADPDAPSGS